MGAANLLLVLLSFRLSSVDTTRQRLRPRTKLCSMDPLGVLLLLGAVCSLFLVLQQGGNAWPWRSGKVIGLLFSFAVLLTLFSIVQWKLGDEATVPLRLLKDRTILMGSLFLALSNASSYVVSDPYYTMLDEALAKSIRRALIDVATRNYITFPSTSKPSIPHLPSNVGSSSCPLLFHRWSPHS